MPPATSAKTAKMIQRWSIPSFIGGKPRGTRSRRQLAMIAAMDVART